MHYKLRVYKSDDYEFVYRLKKDSYINYVIEIWCQWNEAFQRELFENFVNDAKNKMFIITNDKIDIGFLNYQIKESGDLEIGNICIVKEYQRRGIGTQILQDILSKNKNRNIFIQCFKQNPVYVLYERIGFKKIRETKTHKIFIKEKL